jgi:hypothetical protein
LLCAISLVLDVDKFDREINAGTYTKQILNDYYNGITGAPTTFINGELYAMSGVDLLSTVKTMLER